MKNNIFIPKKINVGYQKRTDTYTGKLAYIIYYDEKGNLRKELSWNEWRDKSISNDEFDNIPMEGFVINKHAGGVEHSYGWNARKSYCRIYDPRGFEFEITIENLLYILENCSCIKGKGLEGKFIYGWDGKNLVLMPINAPDYKEIMNYNKIVHENESFKAKDLIIGATYLTKDNKEFIYMGRFETYGGGYEFVKDGKIVRSKYNDDNVPKNYSYINNCPYGKMYWFAKCNKGGCEFEQFKSLPKNKLIKCLDDKCILKYSEIYDAMESSYKFSPIDDSKDKFFDMSFDDFYKRATNDLGNGLYFRDVRFIGNYNGKYTDFQMRTPYKSPNNGKYIVYKYCDKRVWDGDIEAIDIFPTEIEKNEIHMIPVSIEVIYDKLKPVYKQKYLANGREYRKEYD